MAVRELIVLLQACDPDARVWISQTRGEEPEDDGRLVTSALPVDPESAPLGFVTRETWPPQAGFDVVLD